MKKQKQKFRHKPDEGIYGDCSRTVLACLMDIDVEDVPHFSQMEGEYDPKKFFADRKEWIHRQGYKEIAFGLQVPDLLSVLDLASEWFPGVYFALVGESKNGTNHEVICTDEGIYWDPALDNSGIIGPDIDHGLFWVSFLIEQRFHVNAD